MSAPDPPRRLVSNSSDIDALWPRVLRFLHQGSQLEVERGDRARSWLKFAMKLDAKERPKLTSEILPNRGAVWLTVILEVLVSKILHPVILTLLDFRLHLDV